MIKCYRRNPVPHLFVLQGGQLNQDLGGMLDLQQLQDGGSVIGDRDVSHIAHHNLVQADRA